jgi:glycosyltransferase involved in cell wall biosynthesis
VDVRPILVGELHTTDQLRGHFAAYERIVLYFSIWFGSNMETNSPASDCISYSVIIPVHNEEGNVLKLYNRLKPVMEKIGKSYEIIFIDDGSRDKTFKVLERIHTRDKCLKIIKFRKNFGQTAALNAGFDYAKGNIIITMDGDLQNDPRDIPRLIKKMREGYDVVCGWRYNRKDSFTKRAASKFSNWFARKLTGVDIHDSGCSLKAYTKESLKDITLYGEMHRYIPALITMNGFSVTELKVRHNPRKYGSTKYGPSRLMSGFLDLIYIKFWSKYAARPLHFFGLLGVLLLLIGGIIAFYKVFIALLLFHIPLDVGPMLLLSVMLVITGIQFIIFGFLGEIQIRIYFSRTADRSYSIEKIVD